MITLHEHDVKNVTNLGFGSVKDYLSVNVTEELNGIFELEMSYHISGIRYNEFKLRRQLYTKPNPFDNPQLFRIYEITKPIDGVITIYAEHISYDMNGIAIDDFKSSTLSESVNKIKSCSVVENPFTIVYDAESNGGIDTEVIKSMRSILGNNFRKSYKKDYKFDNYTVHMYSRRGVDRGVTIRYGKNLTSLEQDENCADMVTGVYPYWLGQDVESETKILKKLPEKIVNADGTFNFTKVIPYDVTEKYMNEPTEDEIRNAAKAYIKDNKLGQPKVSLDVSFVQLTKSGEYDTKQSLERVELGDTVYVEFPDLGVSSTARCIRTSYDPGIDEYVEITLGDAKSNLSTSISDNNSAIQDQIANQGVKFEATVGTIKIAMADIEYAMIDKADIKDLNVANANIEILNAKTASIETAIIDVAYIKDLNAINANITNLTSDFANIQQLVATKADIGVVNAAIANIGTLTADMGYVKDLVSGNISSGNIQTGGITGSNLNMDTIFVKDANMINVNIGALKAGDISTNKFRIVSDDGGIEIAGATQQFKDKNNKVRLQLGKDSKGDFNFILLGEDGTSTLIDHTGVKPGAIADGLIVNDMIGDGEIGGKKIDISSMIHEVNKDTNTSIIRSSKVQLDTTGQTLDIAFNELKTQTEDVKTITESNSTTINIMQGQISMAINNTQIVKDGQTILLKDDYNRTVSTVNSINSTIGTHKTLIDANSGNIISVDTKVNTVQRDLEGTKSTVSSNSSRIDGLNSTITNQGSSIAQLQNQITLKVEQSDIITAVGNIQNGGRNYALGTKLLQIDTTHNELIPFEISEYLIQNLRNKKLTVSAYSKADTMVYSEQPHYGVDICIQYTDGTITWAGLTRGAGLPITETYIGKRYSKTVQIEDKEIDSISYTRIFIRGMTSVGRFLLKDVMLEISDIPSSYSQAPEDINAYIESVQGEVTTTSNKVAIIQTSLDGITQRVSSTETTTAIINTNLGTTTNTANNALNTANSAQQSANNAMSEINTTRNQVAEIVTNVDRITQRVSANETVTVHYSSGLDKWLFNIYKEFQADRIESIAGKTPSQIIEMNYDNTKVTWIGDNLTIHAKSHFYLNDNVTYNGTLSTDDGSSLYVNGNLISRLTSCVETPISFNLTSGWNTIELVIAEGGGGEGFVFAPNIRNLSQVTKMNAYGLVGHDTRLNQTSNKVAEIITTVDSIAQRVSSTESSISQVDGKIGTAIIDARKIHDTRNDNYNPQHYMSHYPNQTVYEFKIGSVMGIFETNFGVLETNTPWVDSSGGLPVQTFRSNSSPTYERRASSDSDWGVWVQVEDVNGSQSKVNIVDAKIEVTNNRVASIETTVNAITSRVEHTENSITTINNAKEDKNSRYIFARGTGLDYHANSFVTVQGTCITDGQGRGLRINTLDPRTLNLLTTEDYDTLADWDAVNRFNARIDELNNYDFIIIVTSYDASHPLRCKEYLRKIGGSLLPDTDDGYREAYALIGRSKLGAGNGVEMYIPRTATDRRHAEVSVKVGPNGEFIGVNGNNSTSQITSLTTRILSAEQKITESAIINTVSSVINNAKQEAISSANSITDSKLQHYATTSSVTQVNDSLIAKFTASGGYNLVADSRFKKDFSAYWWYPTNGSIYRAEQGVGFFTPINTPTALYQTIAVKPNTTYTLSAILGVENATEGATLGIELYQEGYRGAVSELVPGGITKRVHATITTGSSTSLNINIHHRGSRNHTGGFVVWINELLMTEGELVIPWSPHPEEIYSGSTMIDASGVTINNGAIRIKNQNNTDVMWCGTDGWLTCDKLIAYGNESALEIGGSDSGNRGIGIRSPGNQTTLYLDFSPRAKGTDHATLVATGEFHRIATYANIRNTLQIEVGNTLNVRRSDNNGYVNMTVQGYISCTNNIKTTANIQADGNVTAGGFHWTNGYSLIATESISTIKYANNGGKSYIEIATPKFGTWGADIWASDEHIKENIKESNTKALDDVLKLKHKSFDYINGINVENGFVAQELAEISENLVLRIKQEDGSEIVQPRASGIIPWITKAIQEQNVYVKELETENENLKTELGYQIESLLDNDYRLTTLELGL